MCQTWYCAYENWHRGRGRVHHQGCGYLTPDRMERSRTGDIGPNDRWHDLGFFGTREEAMLEARGRLRQDIIFDDFDFCNYCLG